jgi:hypothetical protein
MQFLNTVLPLGSSVLSFVFAAMVFDQWWQRRHSFQLVWAIGLLWFGVAAGCEFLGSAFGWNEALYRTWYLIGALFVAAYLGAGTIYLLAKTNFGYFAGATVVIGGAFAPLISRRYPGSESAASVVFAIALVGGVAIVVATATRKGLAAHIAVALLVAGSVVATYLVFSAHLAAPGFALDPVTHAPVGSALPGYVRVLTGPFNIAGALCLVFGGVYSAYLYMPKRRVLRAKITTPVVAQLYGVAVVAVNFVASLPAAVGALRQGKLHSRVPATILIALGAFIPSMTSGLNRFGVTWSFFLGEFLGVLLIFIGFLVSEEVFRNVRLGSVIWKRRSLEGEAG